MQIGVAYRPQFAHQWARPHVDGTDYSDLCRSLDVALRVVPERLDFSLDKVAEDAQSLDPLKVSRELAERAFVPFVDRLYESARELCASSDVLLWHYSCWYAEAAALKSGTPDAAVHLYPGLVPTRERPPAAQLRAETPQTRRRVGPSRVRTCGDSNPRPIHSGIQQPMPGTAA